MFRQGCGGNRANYLNFYVGDTIAMNRVTVDLGVRFDRQDGEALPSETAGEPGVPDRGARASCSPATRRRSRGTTSRRAPA